MTTQYKVKQELATFIEQLHKNFGEDAVLKRAEIIRFSERLCLDRRVWLSFLSLGTKQGRSLYSLPRLIDVSVLPAKAVANKVRLLIAATAEFGEHAVVAAPRITEFAEKIGEPKPMWLFVEVNRVSRGMYRIPAPAKAPAKAKTHPMKAVTVNAVIAAVKKRSFGPVNATGRNKVKMIDGHKIMSTKNVLKRLAARNDLPKEMVEQDDETVYRRTTTKRDDDYAVADVIRDHDGGRISFSSSE